MAIVCLAKISPMNPATGSRVDLYVSSANDRNVTGLNGVVWEPAMTASPTLSVSLWQGDFKEPVDTGGASFAVHMGILKMTYANADTYNWAGAPVEVYAEESGTAWPWTARYKGRVSNFSRRNEILSLNSSVQTEPFDKNILTTVYAGTGGAEGGADLKGRLKPLVIGWAKNVEPILIDPVNNVYQFSGYGAIEGVTTLYERAADFGASDGDFATYAALLAASIPAGRWATFLAAGMIRLGAPAAGVITGDIKGHKVGATTPRLTGAVISALATIAGVSTGNIETTTLSALDVAAPYPINLVLADQATFRDMAASLALACNWQSGITLQGKFFVLSVSLSGGEIINLNAQGRSLPQVVTSDEVEVSVPYYKTIFGANRNWRVQSSDEIAFTAELIDRGTYSGAETYREGNIVTTSDGARWLYTNPTAGSGNAPPALPTTSNAYWSNMTDASPVAILGFLTNESHVVAANSSGVVSSFTGASGTFIVQENGETLSSGVTFSLVSSSGVTVSINNTDGTYSATAMSASNGTALLRASYNGVIIDKVFSIAKSAQGADGSPGSPGAPGAAGPPATSAYLTNETAQVFAYANGGVVSYAPATGSFKVFSGTTDISSNFSLSSFANPQALTMVYASQTYTVTAGFDDGEDTASVTIRATGSGAYAGVTFDKVFSLSKAKGGYEIVGSLPSTNLFSGRVVFNEADDKLYRYTGTAWTAAVPAADVAGQLIDTQIQAVSASKIAGLLANSQIEAVAAAKVTGQLSDAQLAAISAAKLTGQIVGTQITDGSVTTAKVAAGAITAGQIAADTITAANIAAGAVTASELAAGSVIAGKVAAGAISATELAANSVVAGKIAANAVSANEIAANAVRVQHLLVAPNNINPDPLFRDEAFWFPQESPGWYFEDAPGSATAITLGYRKYMVLWSGVYAGTSRCHVYSQSVPFSGRGQKLRLRARTNNTSNQDLWVFVEFIDATGGYLGGTYPSTAAGSGASTLSHIFDVPDGVALIRFGFCNSAPGSAFSGVLAVTDVKVDVAADASLIVDGSIIAGKIAANAITADKIEAGAVTAVKVAVTQLSAISATIGLLRTATSGQRLEIENNQIRVYDSSNVLRMRMGVW